jgi:hypothetical protein
MITPNTDTLLPGNRLPHIRLTSCIRILPENPEIRFPKREARVITDRSTFITSRNFHPSQPGQSTDAVAMISLVEYTGLRTVATVATGQVPVVRHPPRIFSRNPHVANFRGRSWQFPENHQLEQVCLFRHKQSCET